LKEGKKLEIVDVVVSRLGFDPSTLALKGRFYTLSVAGCFSIFICLQGFYNVLLCSFFL